MAKLEASTQSWGTTCTLLSANSDAQTSIADGILCMCMCAGTAIEKGDRSQSFSVLFIPVLFPSAFFGKRERAAGPVPQV